LGADVGVVKPGPITSPAAATDRFRVTAPASPSREVQEHVREADARFRLSATTSHSQTRILSDPKAVVRWDRSASIAFNRWTLPRASSHPRGPWSVRSLVPSAVRGPCAIRRRKRDKGEIACARLGVVAVHTKPSVAAYRDRVRHPKLGIRVQFDTVSRIVLDTCALVLRPALIQIDRPDLFVVDSPTMRSADRSPCRVRDEGTFHFGAGRSRT
jgi:hypothetical protein